MKRLDFGSGHNPRDGFQTCDITKSPYLDYIFDEDTYRISCADHEFDYIYVRNVIHHVVDLQKLFRELKRVLKVGGKLIVEDCKPQFYSKNVVLDVLWYRYVIPRYEVWISSHYRNFIDVACRYFDLQEVVDTTDGIRDIATFKN